MHALQPMHCPYAIPTDSGTHKGDSPVENRGISNRQTQSSDYCTLYIRRRPPRSQGPGSGAGDVNAAGGERGLDKAPVRSAAPAGRWWHGSPCKGLHTTCSPVHYLYNGPEDMENGNAAASPHCRPQVSRVESSLPDRVVALSSRAGVFVRSRVAAPSRP